MTKRRNTGLQPPTEGGSYEIGYGKPPSSTRFVKGSSGNPRGRPKGARNKKLSLLSEQINRIILDEAYREIKINEGPRQVTVPVIQAIIRSLTLNAMRGNVRAQKISADLLKSIEQQKVAKHTSWVKDMIEHKRYWSKEIKRARSLGQPEPDPVPHPDHIYLNMETGEIIITGPVTREQRDLDREIIEEFKSVYKKNARLRRRYEKLADEDERFRQLETLLPYDMYEGELLNIIKSIPWLHAEFAKVMEKEINKIRRQLERENSDLN